MRSKFDKLIKFTLLLPPLLAIAIWGYSYFIASESFSFILAEVLGRTLYADVELTSHRVEGLLMRRVIIEELKVNLYQDGKPSGVSFTADTATTQFLGLPRGASLDGVTLTGIKATLPKDRPPFSELDFIKMSTGAPMVRLIKLTDMSFSVQTDDDTYLITDTNWELNSTTDEMVLTGEIESLKIDGLNSKILQDEKPKINVELSFLPKELALKKLRIKGNSGWEAELALNAQFGKNSTTLDGSMELWGLQVNRIMESTNEVSIASNAEIERIIKFKGAMEKLRVETSTNIKNLTYEDKGLGIKAEDVTVDRLKSVRTFNIPAIFKKLLENDAKSDEVKSDNKAMSGNDS